MRSKNKFGAISNKGVMLKSSLIVATLIALAVYVVSVVPVLANTHTPIITISPSLVTGGENDLSFDVKVCNDGSSSNDIHEFRIYYEYGQFTDFTDVQCQSKSGWNLYTGLNGIWGEFCLYTAQTETDKISPGDCTGFGFTADTPETECCRTLRFETRDTDNYWVFVDSDVCVDTRPPITEKIFEGPNKIDGHVEWIDGVTKIVLKSEDPEPHPSGVHETWYKNVLVEDFDYDLPEMPCWDESVCDSLLDQSNQFDVDWKLYEEPFQEEGESCHVLWYYSTDKVGNIEDVKINCFFVDLTPPIVHKDNGNAIPDSGEEMFMTEDNPNGDFHWLTTKMPITFTCEDQIPHPSGDEKLCFKVSYDYPEWGYITNDYCDGELTEDGYCCVAADPQNPFDFYFKEESMHNLEYYCIDAVEKESCVHTQYYKVDDTSPTITKEMIGKDHLGDCPPRPGTDDKCYVRDDGVNGVSISVKDGGEICAVDELSCYYDLIWYSPAGPIYLEEGYEFCDYTEVIFHEDSTHELYIYCEDALGNSVEETETFLVDSTPPETTKTYGDPFLEDWYPKGCITEQCGWAEWITSSTEVSLDATDNKVGVDKTYWRNAIVDDVYCESEINCEKYQPHCSDDEGWNEYTEPFYKKDESCHVIEFYSVDKLGNTEDVKWQCVFVDNTSPTVWKEIGQPKEVKGEYTYITKDTPITMYCEDQGNHPADHVSLWYRYRVSDDCQNWEEWIDWIDPANPYLVEKTIKFPEDSCHELEYYCEDGLGNVADDDGEPFSEIDIVDTKPPTITKEIVGPSHGDCLPVEEGDVCFVDTATEIHVSSCDQEPHPVDDVTCEYSYTVINECKGDLGCDGSGGGISDLKPPFTIKFPEESEHVLTIRCWDLLGNEVVDEETFFVDKTPPETTKWYEGPQYPEQGYPKWITSETEVWLSAHDEVGPHVSGVAATYYRDVYLENEEDWHYCYEDCEAWTPHTHEDEGWLLWEETPFHLKESCHIIEYYSVDNVDKKECVKWQCVFVDDTAPVPEKTVNEPKDQWTPGLNGDPISYFYPEANENCWLGEEWECWEVTQLTPISLGCIDQGDHPVDHNTVCFKVELDGDDATEEYCEAYDGCYDEQEDGFCCLDQTIEEFYFREDTEHELEYYCSDILGNKGSLDIEKFKVEGTMFEIPLFKKWNLISVPFVLMDNNPELVFKDIKEGIESVWTYDPEHVICGYDWCVWTPGEAPDDLKILPGWGYWVLSLEGTTEDPLWLKIGGSLFSPATTPPSKNLVKGWNLIGYYGSSWELYEWGDFSFTCGDAFNFPDRFIYGDKVYCALNSLVDTQEGYPKWSGVWSYINCGNHVDAWMGLNACADGSLQQMLDRMYAGRGYWIEMDVEDLYTPATNCIWNDDFECRWTGGGIFP